MVPLSNLYAFTVACLVLVPIPGPSLLFVVSRGVVLGRRTALGTVMGNPAGLYVQVVAVAFGVGVVIERSAAIYTTVKLLGASYLVWLGVRTFLARRSLAAALDAPVIGAVFVVIALVCDGVWGLLASKARDRLISSPKRLEAIGGAGGVVLVGLGVGLASQDGSRRALAPYL